MKILILANNDMGLYKFRKELLEELLKNNEVFICVPRGDYIEQLIEMGCQYFECKLNRRGMNPLQDLALLKTFGEVISKCKPNMVFTYTIKPNVYGGMICALKGIPYVANITGLGTAVENPGILQKITLILYRLGLRNAQKVFFQNKENQEFMLKHRIIKGSYELLPGSGVNLSQYYLLEYPNGDTVDFVFVGRIMREKGIDQYLDAAKIIREKYPNTRFHICGGCEEMYQETLQNLMKQGIIIYHGLVRDMMPIYEMIQCTIHPTYYPEGLSNTLLESAACGRPIITTNRSGCREVIDDGVNGFVVRQKDSQDLIDKIEKFLNLSLEEKKKMGLAGRRKVEKEFDRNIVVEKYVKEMKNGL